MLIRRLLTYSILSLIALGGFFGNLQIDIGTQTENHITIAYVGNGVYATCSNDPSSVDYCNEADKVSDAKKPADQSAEMTKMLQSLVNGLNIILGFITLAVSPAILFAGWLMSPDWTSGDLFGLRAPMYALWVTVSNIVYFVYAVMLILIALGTMFGNDKFSYKVMLPKLALGILMVPFTWWFVQWTISISAVVTASVMTIPMETISKDTNGWMSQPSIPRKITIQEGTEAGKINTEPCSDTSCIKPIDFLGQQSGMYGHMMVYAYSVFKFEQVKKLPTTIDQVKSVVDIVHQGLIGALMFLVFGLLTLALVAILLVRAVKLWAYAIFAPLFTFQFVAGSVGSDKDMFSIKEFIGLCFVPAIVGLTLSFGLIIINTVSSGQTVGSSTTCTSEKLQNPGCDIAKLMGSDKNKITRKVELKGTGGTTTNTMVWGDMTVDFIGKAGASQGPEAAAKTVNQVTGVLDSAGGIFGTLIIDIIALVFIWLAFMAAKNVSKAVAGAIEPFEKIGSQVGNLAKSLPKYTPLPIPGGSISGASKAVGLAESALHESSNARFEKSGVGKMFGADKYIPKETDKKIVDSLKTIDNNLNDTLRNNGKAGVFGKANAYASDTMKGVHDIAQDEKKTTEFIDKMKLTDAQAKEFREFKSKPKTDETMKKMAAFMNSTFGANAGPDRASGISKAEQTAGSQNSFTMDIQGKPISFKLTEEGKKIDVTDISALKGMKNIMKKDTLIKALQNEGKLTKEATEGLVNNIPKEFFTE